MPNSTDVSSSDRAVFSSALAVIAALAIAAFTYGVSPVFNEMPWSLRFVVSWSYVLSVALLIWAIREWANIHWIGNPTMSMVAGVSGTSIAAIALAFTLNSSMDQEKKLAEQSEVLHQQLQALEHIETTLQTINQSLTTNPMQGTRSSDSQDSVSLSIERHHRGKLGHTPHLKR